MTALCLGLAGCGPKGTPTASPARPIEMLVPTDAETLDPRHATDAVALRTTRLLHAGLVRLDPDTLAPQPYLAERWDWKGPRTLHVRLRTGVKFHSGAPFRALDVRTTIHAFQSHEVNSRHSRVVDAIGDIDIEGDHDLVFHLVRPHATLLTDLEVPILRADEAMSPPRPDGSLDGLGPFVVGRRAYGEIELTPAKDSAVPSPAHGVVIRTVHDENARALRMHAGRADLVVNAFSPTLLPALEHAPGVTINSRRGANLTYMLMRTDRGPLADVHIRLALARAIDRERIARTLLTGHAQAAHTLLPPSHWAHSTPPPPPSGSVSLEDAKGANAARGLHLTLLTSTDRLRGTIARFLAQELAQAGITIEVVPLELGTLLGRLGAGDFELATLQLPEMTEPNVLRVFLHSSSIPPAGANRGRVKDEIVDRLLDEGAASNDPQVRRGIYGLLETRVRDQALLLPLWHEDQIAVTSERARAFIPSAEGRWMALATLP